jgi:hypothetical protein
MDVRSLAFQPDSFDVVIDKGKNRPDACPLPNPISRNIHFRNYGRDDDCQKRRLGKLPNLDGFLTQFARSQNPAPEVIQNCTKEIDEVMRVLRPGSGVFLYLTFGQPHFRRRYLQRDGTSIEVRELGEAFHYYLYILRMSTK